MEQTRVGIIGLGGMGHGHLSVLSSMEEFKVTAVCDVVEEKMRTDEKTGLPTADTARFTDWRALLRSGLCDMVCIATPHPLHSEITVEAFRTGHHVLCEKPIAVSASEADRMLAAHRESGKLFSTNFSKRPAPYAQEIRRIVRSGELGKLIRADMVCTQWLRSEAYFASSCWRGRWVGEGGGFLMNQAPHDLDMLWYWFGDFSSVSAQLSRRMHRIETEDEANLFLRRADGFTVRFYGNTGEAPGETRCVIVGDKGTLVLENGKLSLLSPERSCSETIFGPELFPDVRSSRRELLSDDSCGDCGLIWKSIAKALRTNADALLAPGAEALHEVELADAAYLSHFTGKIVSLPLDRGAYDGLLADLRSGKIGF